MGSESTSDVRKETEKETFEYIKTLTILPCGAKCY